MTGTTWTIYTKLTWWGRGLIKKPKVKEAAGLWFFVVLVLQRLVEERLRWGKAFLLSGEFSVAVFWRCKCVVFWREKKCLGPKRKWTYQCLVMVVARAVEIVSFEWFYAVVKVKSPKFSGFFLLRLSLALSSHYWLSCLWRHCKSIIECSIVNRLMFIEGKWQCDLLIRST